MTLKKLGRVGVKSLLLYLITTVIAIVLGLLFAEIFQPGAGLGFQPVGEVKINEVPSISQIILIHCTD